LSNGQPGNPFTAASQQQASREPVAA
jgi:hypothetical protein